MLSGRLAGGSCQAGLPIADDGFLATGTTITASNKNSPASSIRVDTINPGVVETEGTHSDGVIGSDFEKAAIAQTPLGRIGQPGDIASIAVFLASEDSAWLTGEQILVTGVAFADPQTTV